jgi:hypothetical protein
MLDLRNPAPWLLGIIALAAILFSVRRHLTPEARERRRRDRNYRRVISRKQGPTVRLAVNADHTKRHGKS